LLRRTMQTRHPPTGETVVRLPWGLDLKVDPSEALGRGVLRNGIVELIVSEMVLRLIEPGETAVDAGANIGYMTSLMTLAAGPRGTVTAVEPHPDLFRRLSQNVPRWEGLARVNIYEVAASDHSGDGELWIPPEFDHNAGLASLDPSAGGVSTPVALRRLDSIVRGPVGLLKLDVEGHELLALRGAASMLRDRAIRDIVYEDHHGYPSPVSEELEAFGYRIFGLEQHLFGPRLVPPSALRPHPFGGPPSYVATVAPDRASSLARRPGWQALRRPR